MITVIFLELQNNYKSKYGNRKNNLLNNLTKRKAL